jgi:hypothetical protein
VNQKKLDAPVPAGDLVNYLLKKFGLSGTLNRHRIVELWPKIVDSSVARHAKAVGLNGPVLHVIVDSSVWMNELSALREILLRKINAALDENSLPITDIRFRHRSWASSTESPEKAEIQETVNLSDEDHMFIEWVLQPVSNDEVRSSLKMLLEKDRVLRKRRRNQSS